MINFFTVDPKVVSKSIYMIYAFPTRFMACMVYAFPKRHFDTRRIKKVW